MSLLVQILIGLGASLVFGWLILLNASPSEARVASLDDLIDPKNAYQIGYLVGMAGGSVADVSVVRLALERFEQAQGYKPTLRDAAVVVGLMDASPFSMSE